MSPRVLVVAGEASGDRAAAAVVARLVGAGAQAFGMGGQALRAAGADLVSDLAEATAMGVGEVARRGLAISRARRALNDAVRARGPVAAALLVNYTEFNLALAAKLKAEGVRVLWYVAPQIWAWRAGRASKVRRVVDRMAVILPFEEALWREHGVDARYVGHPSLEDAPLTRAASRAAHGMTPLAPAVALLPGSRPHEVRALLEPMLEAYERVRHDRATLDARLVLASSLDTETTDLVLAASRRWKVPIIRADARTGAAPILAAFDVALCASGTVSLEAALARAVPIVSYRVGWATELAVRPFLRTTRFALPNVLLGRDAFPELLQRDATADKMASALHAALGARRPELLAACDELRPIFGERAAPSRAVAEMMSGWL